MHTIILKLNPEALDNPDLDVRYRLPDLLAQRSDGMIEDDGYDYAQEGVSTPDQAPSLLLFLRASDLEAALTCIFDVVENVRVLDNDLRRSVVVAVEQPEGDRVVYPQNYAGVFSR